METERAEEALGIASARRSFAEEGFVVVRDALEETAFKEVRALMEAEAAENAVAVRDLLRLDAEDLSRLGPEERDLVSGNFARSFKSRLELAQLLRSPRLRAVLSSLLDTRGLYVHMYPSPRWVLPDNGLAAVPRHSDRQYNAHLSHFVTVWVPIDCFEAAAGGVVVHPRSHLARTAPTDERLPTGLWFSATGDVPAEDGVLQVLAPRDVLLIDEHLLHASAPNRSRRTRLSIDLRVFGDHDVTSKHYLDCQDWTIHPPFTGKRHGRQV